MLTVAQLAPLKDRDPYLYETLVKIVASVNATSQRAGVDPNTPAPAPSPIASVTVQATNGWFDISITDPSDARPGLFYFAESDVTPAFGAPRVTFLAGLFSVHRVAAFRAGDIRRAAHRGRRRRLQRPRAVAFQRKRRFPERHPARRKRFRHSSRLARRPADRFVEAGL
ncbi:MAG: hypothetical protein DMG43_13980 [Acidobacteria bacterium]|nr:MAG: hypothetical protein DMG43_13980 [Acidobacteriota bacterium]